MFATPKMLLKLKTYESWYADGTFKVAPQQFHQLYTIHAEKDGYIFLCVYVLVTEKNGADLQQDVRKVVRNGNRH